MGLSHRRDGTHGKGEHHCSNTSDHINLLWYSVVLGVEI